MSSFVRKTSAECLGRGYASKSEATEGMRENVISKNMPPPPLKTADQFAATVASDVALWQTLAKPVKLIVD